MQKKFKIKQNLEKKYNGENLPIRVRQDDVGTIIESQIFTEENNPYDLTNCKVLFNLQPASGLPILGEQAVIKDAVNGIINYSLSPKDTRKAGKTKAAFFTITNKDNSVTESTGDIDLTILPFPKILDSDYIKIIGNFKGRKRLDRNSNPNEIWMADIVNSGYGDNVKLTFDKDPAVSEAPESIYKFFNNPIYSFIFARGQENADQSTVYHNHLAYIPENANSIFYLFKIDPRTVKIRINNLYNGDLTSKEVGSTNNTVLFGTCTQIFVANRSLGITDNVGDLGLSKKGFQKSLCKDLTPNLNLSGYTPLQNEAFTNDPSINDKLTYTSSFELDLTKNNFLTSDNYLMLFSPRVNLAGTGIYFACIAPQIECIQYYLPE